MILTHEAAERDVRGWLAAAGRDDAHDSVVATDDFLGFSVWAEDAYVVIVEDGGHAFVEPAAFPRYGDALVADQVSTAAQLGLFQAPLHLQGGNVLIGDDFFFIGIDYPLLTFEEGILTAPDQDGEDALLREVYRRYLDAERTFVPVGTTLPVPAAARREFRLGGATWVEDLYAGNAPGTRQPIFHIDMFVSLAGRGDDGRYRVLVGDPREAARLTGVPLQPHAMAPVFDDIARDLSRRGFAVTRTPLPLVYSDDEQARVRSWYFTTSNNVLVHAPEGARPTVFIPTYAHGPFAERAVGDRSPQRGDLGPARLRRRRAGRLSSLRDQPRRSALHQEVPCARLSAHPACGAGPRGSAPMNDHPNLTGAPMATSEQIITADRRRSARGRRSAARSR